MLTSIKGGREDASYSGWPVIPAHPGFELLTAIEVEGGRIEVLRQYVIGWRIPPDEGVEGPRPIVLEADVTDAEALKYPDGSVCYDCEVYSDEVTWLKDQKKRLKATAAANA